MASISRDPHGFKRILFVAPDSSRKAVRLGKCSLRLAEEVRVKVEVLAASQAAGLALDHETASWLGRIGDDLAAKLAAVGLTS